MTDYEAFFPSKYLKAADLDGKPKLVTIDRWVTEEVGRDKESKAVIYFREEEHGLVCNKTNAGRIANLYGRDIDGWIGKEVVIYPDQTDFAGKTVDCIRVRGKKGAIKPTLQKIPTEDVPFDDEIPY